MDCAVCETALLPRLDETMDGEWYLMGFEDAYRGHVAMTPSGPAGEHYGKGYAAGLEAVQRDFFAAISEYSVSLQVPIEP